MHRAVIFLSLAAAIMAGNDFSEKYTFTKIMASCLGEDVYYDYLAQVGAAQRECQQLPVSSLQTVGYPYYHQPGYLNSPPHHLGQSGPVFGIPQGYPQSHGIPQNYPHQQGGIQTYPHQQGRHQIYPQHQGHQIYNQPQGGPHIYSQHQGGPPIYHPQQGGPQIYPQHQGGSQSYPQYPAVHNTYPQYHGPKSYSHFLQKRESNGNVSTEAPAKKPFFDQYYLLDSINTITASLSNYTCVLHKLGHIDEYLNLRVDNYIQQINQKPISQELKKDLADGATYCRDLTYCLPLERLKSPLPLNLQRLLLAMKCEKETRTDACFKEDIRRNIHEFDLSLFPKDDTQESKLNKLSAIVMEADSVDELQVL
ncbi:uncharacterized protein [Palaemon carinicauda]|uniref:uncharacterized protein n=1 Tax=Palaemon carinicauda TaxID=392227 RepID=UPI0035B60A6E